MSDEVGVAAGRDRETVGEAVGEVAGKAPAAPAAPAGGRWFVARILIRTIRVTLMVVVLLPLMTVVVNTCRTRTPTASTPSERGMVHEDVTLRTDDGVDLAAWWIPSPDPDGYRTLLVCHGVGANRDDLFRFYPFLNQGGYHILTWDWRGHGSSGWARTTFGLNERRDVKAAVAWLRRHRPRESRWLGAFAISMGAGIMLQAAGENPEIQAFVLDSPFASIRTMLPHHFRFIPAAVAGPFLSLTCFYAHLVLGTGVDAIAPVDHIGRIAPRPLLLMHGTGDVVIPHQETERLAARAGNPHELWIAEGALHTAIHEQQPGAYELRVLTFLERAVRASRRSGKEEP